MRGERKIKICQVATAEISVRFLLLNHIRYLRRQGYEVHAAATGGKWTAELRRELVFWDIPMTRRLWTPIADLKALWKLILLFRREKYDIVHTHTPKASFLGQLAASIAGVPVRVYTVHGLFFLETSSWRRKLFFGMLERIMAFLVHRALFVNREDMETVRRRRMYPAKKIRYVGGAIDTEHFDPARFPLRDRERRKRELGIEPGSKVVGIVARLVWEKGYRDLFKAFRMVLVHYPNAVLLVVGPEEPEKEDGFRPQAVARHGIQERALFVGEQTDIPALLSIMDVFVLPSYREGLGLSLLEASAMELPVVATDIRGCREAVEHGKTGLLVPVRSPAMLAEAISFILSHAREAESMGRAGRKKVRKEFEKSIVYSRIEKEYKQLIRERFL